MEKSYEDFKILNVVVYREEAEITRSGVISVDHLGEVKLSIYGLTKLSLPDSIRVKATNTNCNILEVSHEITNVDRTAASDVTRSAEVQKQIEELENALLLCQNKIQRLSDTRGFIQNFASSAFRNSTEATTRVSITEAKDVMVYYQNETTRVDEEIRILNKEKDSIGKELSIQQNILRDILKSNRGLTKETRTLFLNLEIKTVGEVELQFSYVVTNATWTPSYDIRVNNSDCSLALSYFAEVTQTSGENWRDCDLFLSTSNPSIGSNPPPLPLKTVDWKRPTYRSYEKKMKNRRAADKFPGRGRAREESEDEDDASCHSLALLEQNLEMAMDTTPMSFQTQMPSDYVKAGVVGNGDMGSTVFTIPRKVTIDCDNKPHKVMITARNFKPQMVHYAVPSVSSSAYIQAKTQNNSPYPLLASDNVSIYLDGNFVSKSSLKQTNAGESFQIFLGVDPSIKIEYLPVRKEEYRKGWVQGVEVRKLYHSTILQNTKSVPIRIIMAESLPRTNNEKITVDLMEPAPASLVEGKVAAIPETTAQDAISSLANYSDNADETNPDKLPKDFITKNKMTNNIVWLKTLKPQEKTQINFSYRLSWPQGSSVSEF